MCAKVPAGLVLAAALTMVTMALAVGAAAQPQAPEEDPDDAPEARIDQSDPRTRDGCSVFQVMADDLPKDNGDFAVYRDAPGPDDPVYVEREFWTADAEEPDGDFQMGSRIIQTSDPGPFYGKVFWWEDGEERVLVTETERIECEGQQEPAPAPEPAAPPQPEPQPQAPPEPPQPLDPLALAGAAFNESARRAVVVADVRLDALGAAEGTASLGAATVDGPRLAGATVLGETSDGATRVWLRFENVSPADVRPAPNAQPLQLDRAELDPQRDALAFGLNVSLGAALTQAEDAAVQTTRPSDAEALSAWGGAPDARLTVANVSEGEAFVADFHSLSGGEWWVQVQVDANRGVFGVEARVDGGAWQPLEDKSWGWAKSVHAPNDSEVQFRAMSEGGALAVSEPVQWPPT